MEDSLPVGVCIECYGSAAQAGDFRATVQNAQHHWNNMTHLLQTVPEYQYSKKTDRVTAVLYNNSLYISEKNTKVPSQGDYEYGLPLKRIGKQHDCSCPNCGKAFAYPLHLYKHLKESADLVRACHLCARIMTRDNLVTHLKDIHLIKPYNCTECPALYLHEVQFKKHILEAHAPGACTCGDCGRSFKSISAYHAHQAVHYLFSASSRRSEHILSTHKKREIALRHGCSFCPARFRVPHKLKNHVSMVHGDKGTDEWEWKCGKCKEKFKSCRSLVHHSRNHKS